MLRIKRALVGSLLLPFILGNAQCAGMPAPPVRPSVELCHVYAPEGEAPQCLCGMTEQDAAGRISATLSEWKPITYCHKATAFPPASWEKMQNYVDETEAWVKAYCGK